MKLLLRILATLALLGAATEANAAVTLISTASGDIGTTGTWSVVDTTGTNAYLNSETANTALTTSPVASSTFTPAAETVTAIAVKLAAITGSGPSGTLTVKLANSTSAGNRECTQTVNVADLVQTPSVPTAALADGGWVVLTCSAVPNGTDAYTINANTSVASGVSTVNLFSLATTNWSRFLVTTGTQANGPAAGDQFIVAGNLSGAGTHNAYIVTINTTANVNYGNVANTLVNPSAWVGQWGTFCIGSAGACGPVASTAYKFEVAGPLVVYSGGTLNFGTVASDVPSTGSATVTLNSTVEGDTGIVVRNGGTMTSVGDSGGRTVVKTLLNTIATANLTATLTVADSTGWLSGDTIVIAGTNTPGSSQAETATVGTVSGTSIPITGGGTGGAVVNTHTANAFSYTSSSTNTAYALNMYAEVINLTRNVVIQGSGATTNGYIFLQANAAGTFAWTGFTLISGSGSVAGKIGLEADTGPLGALSITNCSFYTAHNTPLYLAPTNTNFGGLPGTPVLVQHNVIYNVGTTASTLNYGAAVFTGTINPNWKIDDLTIIAASTVYFNSYALYLGAVDGQVSNVTISSSGNGGNGIVTVVPTYNGATSIGGTVNNAFGPFTVHSNAAQSAFTLSVYPLTGKISGLTIWNNVGPFKGMLLGGDLTIDPFYEMNANLGIYTVGGGTSYTFRNGVIGGATFTGAAASTQGALVLDANSPWINFDNMELCPTGAHGGVTFVACSGANAVINPQNDLTNVLGGAQVSLRNSSDFGATDYPTLNGQVAWMTPRGYVVQDCAACTVIHGAWVPNGYLSYDTAITHSSGYSERITPFINTVTGYIVGTTLTLTSGAPTYKLVANTPLSSNAGGFVSGTSVTAGSGTSYTVNISQTAASSGSPKQFQVYSAGSGTLPRLQSAPYGQGLKVAVASGGTAQVCVWVRESNSGDGAPPWGGSAATYNADAPRMINRANPAMGIQADTVITTTGSPSSGSWVQMCGTTPTAPQDGAFEIVIDADQTFTANAGGSVNIAEWSCSTTCGTGNNSQYWWNGQPTDFIAPTAPAGGGGFIIGG